MKSLYSVPTIFICIITSLNPPVDIAGKIQETSHEKLYVTAMIAKEGLLWVGTDQGLILTYPLPRLGGIPKVNGQACVSFHAHEGSVRCLNAFRMEKNPLKREEIGTEDTTFLFFC